MSAMSPPPPGRGEPATPGPPPGAAGSSEPTGGPPTPPRGPESSAPGEGAEIPPPAMLKNLWEWARGYIRRFGWALAPVWLPVDAVSGGGAAGMKGCCCPDGEACTNWGKHLVSGLGVAREERDVEKVWPVTDVRVRNGWIGLGMLTGSDSKTVVLDVQDAASAVMTKARFKVSGHVLTQETPTGGQHWFFRLEDDEAVTGGRTEIELVTGVWVLGDGAFVVLTPRSGYHWADGSKAAMSAGLTDATDALRMRLMHESLITSATTIEMDAPWRTRPGTPLVGGDPRTYTRRGDIRRLVDAYGDKMLFTPGLGWRVWTESGWGGTERSETMLKSFVMDLPDIHRAEGRQLKIDGKTKLGDDAWKWASRSLQRPASTIMTDLESDERVLVPSATDWDAEGYICGLPVVSGVGRLVDLRTGQILLDQRTRRVSKTLGAQYEDGAGSDLKWLWNLGEEGGPGRWFVKYISDLVGQMGPDAVRLLQRAAGASLYGRREVNGDTDAVFVLKGPARSGKSTFAECLLAVAGAYGKAMGHNLLFGDRGNPEFADAAVFGYRVMTLSEPPMHADLNTTKLKQLSGGDSITGRLPYGKEEISFQPECSLWLMTNHALEVADEAVWRRLKFFRFEHTWEGASELPELRKAITQDVAELRLAAAWMIEGAKAWAIDGWGDTTVWSDLTADEKSKHNVIEKWLADCLEVTRNPADEITHPAAQSSFQMWLTYNGEDSPKMSRNAIRDEIEGACVRAGLVYDRHKKKLTGGRLV